MPDVNRRVGREGLRPMILKMHGPLAPGSTVNFEYLGLDQLIFCALGKSIEIRRVNHLLVRRIHLVYKMAEGWNIYTIRLENGGHVLAVERCCGLGLIMDGLTIHPELEALKGLFFQCRSIREFIRIWRNWERHLSSHILVPIVAKVVIHDNFFVADLENFFSQDRKSTRLNSSHLGI